MFFSLLSTIKAFPLTLPWSTHVGHLFTTPRLYTFGANPSPPPGRILMLKSFLL